VCAVEAIEHAKARLKWYGRLDDRFVVRLAACELLRLGARHMRQSKFNVRVPVEDRNEVFLLNTLSDAQLLVPPDVNGLLERLDRGETSFDADEQESIEALRENGFIVESHAEERRHLQEMFANMREDTEQLRLTVLTTLQCNFACDYCLQGDHGDHNLMGDKMSVETAHQIVSWVEERLDQVHPEKFVITFFGGEPLLNIPVIKIIAEGCHALCQARGVTQRIIVITNGLLLTPAFVDTMLPLGLQGVKVTLDGDRETHNRMRPLRGRQGTFDRIVENVRQVADKVGITIGGNFDESSVDSFPALLDYLQEQDFAPKIKKVNFKPIIKTNPEPKGIIPLTVVGASGKPLNGACMTGAGAGSSATSMCSSCNFVEEKMSFLLEETRKHGFPAPDGVHMGPCEIHRRHAYTVGIDGSLYACPGFGSEPTQAIDHINRALSRPSPDVLARFEQLTPLKEACGDCSFVPVCGGGCSVAANSELGDLHAPACHKSALEQAVVSLAQRTAASYSSTTTLPGVNS
jgi:uncharacterized protein